MLPGHMASEADRQLLVRVQRDGAVTTLTLDSPANRNALSARLVAQLTAALGEAEADPAVRVVVLTGSGTVFCSGADLRERKGAPPSSRAPGSTIPELFTTLVTMGTPVVARVNGAVRAGGLGLVASCDLAAAPPEATFAFTEVRVGVAPAMIAVPLLRLIDRRSFVRYALTAETFGAAEAAEAGLLTAVAEDLDGWVAATTGALLRAAPSALAATKRLVDEVDGRSWAEGLAAMAALADRLFAGPEAAEGMAAFLEKRPPAWTAGTGGGA